MQSFWRVYPTETIRNGVDINRFSPKDRIKARQSLGVDADYFKNLPWVFIISLSFIIPEKQVEQIRIQSPNKPQKIDIKHIDSIITIL